MSSRYRGPMSVAATRRSTGALMLVMVREAVEARLDRPLPEDLDKRGLLACLPRAVEAFSIGRSLRVLSDNPVVRAIVQAPSAEAVLTRWQSIESFGHSTHRTRIADISGDVLTLEHVCLDGETIPAPEDFFVWGLVAGLLELWSGRPVDVLLGEAVIGQDPVGAAPTTRATVRAVAPPTTVDLDPDVDTGWTSAVEAVVKQDLLRTWSLASVAATLHRSSRSLQRDLRAEGARFSTVLQKTRVDAALDLVANTDLGLTEIAFCSGFSDHAHLTRTTRKIMDAPPSSLRTLLRALEE